MQNLRHQLRITSVLWKRLVSMKCLYCHNTMEDGYQFCAECGYALSVESKLTYTSPFWKNFQNNEKIERANYAMYVQNYITKAHNQYRLRVLVPFVAAIIASIMIFVPIPFGNQMSIADNIRNALENGILFQTIGQQENNHQESEWQESEWEGSEWQESEWEETEQQKSPSKSFMSIDEKLQYFINNCGNCFFTRSDIDGFDKEMSMFARNSVYAQAGMDFSNFEKLYIYFTQYDWYNPTISPSNFRDSMMNRFEVVNLYVVLDYEMEMGFRTIRDVDRRFKNFIISCDSEVFSLDDLQDFDADMTLIARSAIYAKSGQAFDSEYLDAFFNQFDWYAPEISERNFRDDLLNSCQRKNLDIISTYERQNGF